jgi:hypothetical protein
MTKHGSLRSVFDAKQKLWASWEGAWEQTDSVLLALVLTWRLVLVMFQQFLHQHATNALLSIFWIDTW